MFLTIATLNTGIGSQVTTSCPATLHITLHLIPDVQSHQAENNLFHTPIKDYCFKYCTALQTAMTETHWVELRLNIYPLSVDLS